MPAKESIQDAKLAQALEDMLHTEGWKHYKRILELHINQKINEALAPVSVYVSEVDGIKQVLAGEAAKGAILGLKLALSLPSGIVEQQKKSNPSLAGD